MCQAKASPLSSSTTRPVEDQPSITTPVAFLCTCSQAQFGPKILQADHPGSTKPVKAFGSRGSEHLVSENASPTEPASLLAVFVADDGAQLTVFDK